MVLKRIVLQYSWLHGEQCGHLCEYRSQQVNVLYSSINSWLHRKQYKPCYVRIPEPSQVLQVNLYSTIPGDEENNATTCFLRIPEHTLVQKVNDWLPPVRIPEPAQKQQVNVLYSIVHGLPILGRGRCERVDVHQIFGSEINGKLRYTKYGPLLCSINLYWQFTEQRYKKQKTSEQKDCTSSQLTIGKIEKEYNSSHAYAIKFTGQKQLI